MSFRIAAKQAGIIFSIALTAMLLKTSPAAQNEVPAQDDFTFVVWGDSQLDHPEIFERVVRETELLRPDFVIQVGDLIHGYTYDPKRAAREWAAFKQQIAPLSVPYYPVPGNHDITTAEIDPVYGQAWGKHKPYYYSFDHDRCHFIVLSSFENQVFDTIGPEQEQWLREDLESHKDALHIFVALHSPLHMDADPQTWSRFHDLFRLYPVRAVFTGHSHIYDYSLRDGIHYFCLNSSGVIPFSEPVACTGYSRGYLIVRVKGQTPHFVWSAIEGGLHPPDFVAPFGYRHAARRMAEDQTLLIPNPTLGPVHVTVKVPLVNSAPESRSFTLEWECDDYRWEFSPRGMQVADVPGTSTVTVEFSIRGPKGEFHRRQLPRLRVQSPYRSPAGCETTLTHYFHLFYPPETSAVPLAGEWHFDGQVNDPAWAEVPAITKLVIDDQDTPAPERTIAKVAWDSDNLYVGVKGEEPNPAGLAAFAHGKIPLVFGDDDFELYFDTNRDLKTFFRLMTNPRGTVLCSGPKGLFTFTFDVKTYVGTDYWSAEFRIPFSQLGVPTPKQGDVWGFNLRRHRQQADPAQSDWSKMRNFPYEPAYFGLLKFE